MALKMNHNLMLSERVLEDGPSCRNWDLKCFGGKFGCTRTLEPVPRVICIAMLHTPGSDSDQAAQHPIVHCRQLEVKSKRKRTGTIFSLWIVWTSSNPQPFKIVPAIIYHTVGV